MTKEEVVLALQTEICGDIGEHEWDNSWVRYSITEMTEALNESGYTLIGYFYLQEPKPYIRGIDLDIGLVCEYKDKYRFWCHHTKKIVDEAIENYKERGR